MKVRFAFVGEGTSDLALWPHLEELCVQLGAREAIGYAPDLSRLSPPPGIAVADKLEAIAELHRDVHFVCVHRDADRAGFAARCAEIEEAAAAFPLPVVPIVPVTMIEAWLLLNPDEIRAAVGVPPGRGRLDLPGPGRIESVPNPKKLLEEALATASGETGRRLKRVKKSFNENRRFLLERLDIDGPVTRLPAWQAMLGALKATLDAIGVSSSA